MSGLKGFFDWYHENGIIPNIWKGATGQLSQEKINAENLDYQRERNRIEDARYEDETKYNRAFAENERAYNRAFAAEEQAYNRAFAEDERNYQRDWALNERDYQRSLQQQIFEREDTAIERQAQALRALGINPLSQTLNGLGAGSVVSSSSPGSSSLPGSTSYHSANAPGLSGRQGKALQKAMITSQGINGLLGPILQTMNTVDNLRGAGLQRDILNANAMKAQAEANTAVMEMFDTSNRLNIPEFNFKYGVNGRKSFKGINKSYNPYFYSPQVLNDYEGSVKKFESAVSLKQLSRLDSISDAMKFMTDKLSGSKWNADGKVLNSFTSIIESLLLKAFK